MGATGDIWELVYLAGFRPFLSSHETSIDLYLYTSRFPIPIPSRYRPDILAPVVSFIATQIEPDSTLTNLQY